MKSILQSLLGASPALAGKVERLAERFEQECGTLDIRPEDARVIIMWGGGKDSTLALLLGLGVSELVGCHVRAVTMAHPGLSAGTRQNIFRLCQATGVQHEWRSFVAVHADVAEGIPPWRRLYRTLARATAMHPRFMCVACNMGSLAVEYSALSSWPAQFVVTGNPAGETEIFDQWAHALRAFLAPHVAMPEPSGLRLLDWYRLWWTVYRQLFIEMTGLPEPPDAIGEGDFATYMYEYPPIDGPAARAKQFPILSACDQPYRPSDHAHLLASFGWLLPEDIPGGTESDCVMPAVIARLNVARVGLETHLKQLHHAAHELSAPPDMLARATAWAREGRSHDVGDRLLADIGVTPGPGDLRPTRIAEMLVSQLLPVR